MSFYIRKIFVWLRQSDRTTLFEHRLFSSKTNISFSCEIVHTAIAGKVHGFAIQCKSRWMCQLFRRRSMKTSKLRVTGTDEFPAQTVSNAENVSIWWRHRDRRIQGSHWWADKGISRGIKVKCTPWWCMDLSIKIMCLTCNVPRYCVASFVIVEFVTYGFECKPCHTHTILQHKCVK